MSIKFAFVDVIRAWNMWRNYSSCVERLSLISSKFFYILSRIITILLLILWRAACSIASFIFWMLTWVVGLIFFRINHHITNPYYFWSPLFPVHSKFLFSRIKDWKLVLELWSWIPFSIISIHTRAKKRRWSLTCAEGSISEIPRTSGKSFPFPGT